MAARRSALADVSNAVNSPLRNAAAVSGKRTRAQAGENRETIYGQPPTKKQIVEARQDDEENIDPRRRNGVPVTVQNKLDEPFSKRLNNHPPTAFEKKLAAVRGEKKTTPQPRTDRTQKHTGDNLESVRQWQKHYRRQFPQFVFYFDSVPDETRSKAMRQIHSLGAREEKFFSKAVTHVVTSRSIPSEPSSTSPDDESKYDAVLPKTVQPSAITQDHRKGATLLDAQIQRRNQHVNAQLQLNADHRKPQTHSADILSRARALGIKIWALEKLHRVLSTILDADTGDRVHESRGHATQRVPTRQAQEADLEQLLRHEKVNGPADRDMTVATQDMVTLRGCYLYVHDMEERSKPTLARDYTKPSSKEQGKWPQFRLTSSGRCPFIEDPVYAKKMQQEEKDAQSQLRAQHELAQRKTRGGATLQPTLAQALVEREANLRRSPRKLAQAKQEPAKPLNPSMPAPTMRRQSSLDLAAPFFGSAQASLRGLPRMVGGEPVASGMQPSNVTSAIRSQAISSAAISSTAPGFSRRVGDTKEVSLLKRKVLASNNSMPSSYVNDVRAAINDQDPPPRAAKRKAQETLGVVHEDEEDGHARARTSAPKKKRVEKDPKPGYCENCRDKYEDFDEHILSRKHRKFATSQENWKDLDKLLQHLKRPHKEKS